MAQIFVRLAVLLLLRLGRLLNFLLRRFGHVLADGLRLRIGMAHQLHAALQARFRRRLLPRTAQRLRQTLTLRRGQVRRHALRLLALACTLDALRDAGERTRPRTADEVAADAVEFTALHGLLA